MCKSKPYQELFFVLLVETKKIVTRLDKKVGKFMTATQDKLDALATQMGEISQTLTTAAEGLAADIAALKEQVQNGETPDFTAVDARVQELTEQSNALAGLDAENPQQP